MSYGVLFIFLISALVQSVAAQVEASTLSAIINRFSILSSLPFSINRQPTPTKLVVLRHLKRGKLQSIGAMSDVFHILSSMWKTPTERCFVWLGGFHCSEVLKILGNQIEPLTKQQLTTCNRWRPQ